MVLKAELHCHLEGAAQPELVERLARKYGMDMSEAIKDHRYLWTDFSSFLSAYEIASAVFREPEDYHLLAYHHYTGLADQDCIYAEVFIAPDLAGRMGIDYLDMVEAIAAGMQDAKDETGIEGRMIATGIRHLGPDAVEHVAEVVTNNPHKLVTGFGMAGDERAFEVKDFANAFSIASDAGLGLTCHAGEFDGPESVRATLEHLDVARIGHGVRAIEDRMLVDRLAQDGVVLEVCPLSNVALDVYPSLEAHPIDALYAAGVSVTLNSDDPPFFNTSIEKEYSDVKRTFDYSEATMEAMTRTAIEAAFIDEATRLKLLSRLNRLV